MLPEPFVIPEQKRFVLLDRSAGRYPELVPLKRRSGALVEEIRRIQRIVPQVLIHRTMPLVSAGLGNNHHLPAWPFAQLCAVGIPLHVKLAHGLHAQQHSAWPPRSHVVFRRPGVLHTVQKKKILLRAIARDGKIARGAGVRNPRSAGFLRSEIDDAWVQRQQQVVTPSVQWKILHRLLSHQAADVPRRHAYNRRVASDLYFRLHRAHLQSQVDAGFLANYEGDAAPHRVLKATLRNAHFIPANGQRQHQVSTGLIRARCPDNIGLQVLYVYGRLDHRRACGIRHYPTNTRRHLRLRRRHPETHDKQRDHRASEN